MKECIAQMPEAFTSADMAPVVSVVLGMHVEPRTVAWHLNALWYKGQLRKIKVSCSGTGNKANIFMRVHEVK